MKRCPNPACESAFLFGNDKTRCPFCHSLLVSDLAGADDAPSGAVTPDQAIFRQAAQELAQPLQPRFLRQQGRRVECHGRIVELEHQELFHSRGHKLFNTLLRGEPYQLAHQTVAYTVRVENITAGIPGQVTDFCLFGNYLGRLQVGDEVEIRAVRSGDRRLVRSIYNQTTGSPVRHDLQLSAALVRCCCLLLAAACLALLFGLVWMLCSGAALAALTGLLSALLPLLLAGALLCWLVRRILPRRRR